MLSIKQTNYIFITSNYVIKFSICLFRVASWTNGGSCLDVAIKYYPKISNPISISVYVILDTDGTSETIATLAYTSPSSPIQTAPSQLDGQVVRSLSYNGVKYHKVQRLTLNFPSFFCCSLKTQNHCNVAFPYTRWRFESRIRDQVQQNKMDQNEIAFCVCLGSRVRFVIVSFYSSSYFS